ncbi:MAG: RIP metalloprotease RseP [Elusimicrobia bacterium]|nr:RIP metalloprotease RseP [Elusimicrobiota bacterium]MBU2615249.1 RIP metalloprotease RseP [Elusimicrobiota bacterium]
MLGALAVIFTFGIIIFLHELGHFVSAKMVGMKVEKFAFGFGPEIVGKTVGETRYAICWVPLGGMVKLAGGMDNESKGDPGEFFAKPWYKRVLVVASGPLMNYVLALVFFFIAIYFWGLGVPTEKPVIGEVRAGYPAAKAGIKSGDMIISINGQKIKLWQDAAEIIHKQAQKKLVIKIRRHNEVSSFEITPQMDKDFKVGVIGIMPDVQIEKVGMAKSFLISAAHTIEINIVFFVYMWDRITKMEKPEVSGPIGIAQVIAQTAKVGFSNLLILIGRISVMVGLMNLLPIPIFDGGHIMFFTIEGLITKKRASNKVIETTNYIGLTIIVLLMVFAFYSDFERIGLFTFTKKFFGY